MDRQVEEELSEVRDFIAGRSGDRIPLQAVDMATRQLVAAELLAVMSRPDAKESSAEAESVSSGDAEAMAFADWEEQQQLKRAPQEEQERSRKLFMDHGYFDETVHELRGANSAQQRASAARALGVVGSKRGTLHLIAAMFDDDPEVRNAAEEAMAQMNGPMESIVSMNTLPGGEPGWAQSQSVEEASLVEDALADDAASQEPKAQDRGELETLGFDHEADAPPESMVREQSPEAATDIESSFSSSAADEFDDSVQQVTQEIEIPGSPQATPGIDDETSEEMVKREAIDTSAVKDADQLLLEEQGLRETVKQLERKLVDAAAVRMELEKEVVLSVERESRLRAEAASRRRKEEELRKRADEEAEHRRSHESEALTAEQATRAKAQTEAHRVSEEEARMRLETSNLRMAAEELVWQRVGAETAQREAAEAARRAEARGARDEAEKRHNAELTRLRDEEEGLRTATEEAALRRAEVEKAHQGAKAEVERLTKERVQLASAEAIRHAEATRLRQEAKTRHEAEVTRLRSEEEALRAAAEQVARRRAEVGSAQQEAEAEIERLTKERAQLAAAEAARHAETQRIREAGERNRSDQEQLRLELEGLHLVGQEVATRRSEVEAARKKADEDAERMLEMQARIRAEEEASARAESERIQLEAETHQRVTTQQRLLEEARRRAQEEQQRMEEEAKSHAEHEEKRRAELELLQENAEMAAQQRAEEEKQVRAQVDSLRIADAEARKRIEEAETRRRKSEDVYRLVAEKVQRVEAEAHARAIEEEKILTKLEAVRRSAAVEAQARAEQEKRIKEEIELFRKLEDVERPRLEVAALQRKEAQARLQRQRDRSKADEENRVRTEEPHKVMDSQQQASTGEESSSRQSLGTPNGPNHAIEKLEPPRLPATDEDPETRTRSAEDASAPLATSIHTYFNSVDPYKRAAAVAELARSNAKDAFELIAKCFDDHSPQVRNAAARGLLKLEPTRTVDLFNRALETGSEQRRRNIGSAIAESGLASECIDNLVGENREATYHALSILFVMAKTGEVQPLVQAIEEHENEDVCRAVIKLLTLTGQTKLSDEALQRRVMGVSAARRTANGLDQSGTVQGKGQGSGQGQ